jgi:DNA-binding XRE family transcriptional regulator
MDIKKLKGIRVERGYTQELMARKLGVTPKTYNRKDLGIIEFNRREVAFIVKELNLCNEEAMQIFLR